MTLANFCSERMSHAISN